MKKNILYLVAFMSMIFVACNPLKDEINNIKPVAADKTVVLTLANADYGLLPAGNYARTGFYFATTADANDFISVILNKKYPQLGDGTKANISYNSMPAQVKPADSLITNNPNPLTYTVTDADYSATNGNNNKNFTTAKSLEFLSKKYPAAVNNQLSILTYAYFESGSTTSAGVPAVDTFIFLNGQWVKAYTVSQAQYISAGKLVLFNFGAADEPNLAGYFSVFLGSDASVTAKAKLGDVKYVAFDYFASSKTYRRIKPLIFDGIKWVSKPVSLGPLAFLRKKGTWIPDPTVYYTLIKADFSVLDKSGVATDAAIANAVTFASFDITGGANNWTESQITAALILILKTKYASAPVDETVLYKITYGLFKSGVTPTVKTFAKTSTGFVLVPES
ncbi:hypothetical protein ABIE26_003769 [Pedobacter africanus]|uniref:Uncharacterized protein n=1 Tax=Pedobacter africanus TaxID=151894 RepID=A0ACC6L162_9SPHI|nr:hypothetical protein [Pedobacter africanus]MDR6785071.1 hypothetical protein [Pedobacter africanus]